MTPYIKVRNYLMVEEDGELKRKHTPSVMQLLPSVDIWLTDDQLDMLDGVLQHFMYQASDVVEMTRAESDINNLFHHWIATRWVNMPSPDCNMIAAASNYSCYGPLT